MSSGGPELEGVLYQTHEGYSLLLPNQVTYENYTHIASGEGDAGFKWHLLTIIPLEQGKRFWMGTREMKWTK